MNERGTAPSIADHVEETGCFVHPVSSRFRAREHPYPCRYVITSKDLARQPQYTIQVRNWRTGAQVAPTDFAFTNPTNAQKVELKDLRDAAELPAHFMRGEAK